MQTELSQAVSQDLLAMNCDNFARVEIWIQNKREVNSDKMNHQIYIKNENSQHCIKQITEVKWMHGMAIPIKIH